MLDGVTQSYIFFANAQTALFSCKDSDLNLILINMHLGNSRYLKSVFAPSKNVSCTNQVALLVVILFLFFCFLNQLVGEPASCIILTSLKNGRTF